MESYKKERQQGRSRGSVMAHPIFEPGSQSSSQKLFKAPKESKNSSHSLPLHVYITSPSLLFLPISTCHCHCRWLTWGLGELQRYSCITPSRLWGTSLTQGQQQWWAGYLFLSGSPRYPLLTWKYIRGEGTYLPLPLSPANPDFPHTHFPQLHLEYGRRGLTMSLVDGCKSVSRDGKEGNRRGGEGLSTEQKGIPNG